MGAPANFQEIESPLGPGEPLALDTSGVRAWLETHLITGKTLGESEGEEGAVFPDGSSLFLCFNWANQVVEALGPRAKRWGFSGDDNPKAEVAHGGHDFAIVDGRWLVDGWAFDFEQSAAKGVFDLENPAECAEIEQLYGDKSTWVDEQGRHYEPKRASAGNGIEGDEQILEVRYTAGVHKGDYTRATAYSLRTANLDKATLRGSEMAEEQTMQNEGTLHAYASGSGSLTFVVRGEDGNPISGRRPTATECVAYIQGKMEEGQGAWARNKDWLIVNQGDLTRPDHDKFEAVQRVQRLGVDKLRFHDKEYTFDPTTVASRVGPITFSTESGGQKMEVEGTGNFGALGYFLRNEKILSNPDRIVWESMPKELIGPSFAVGQRFDFKVGQPVIANGYRGTVKETYTGEMAGMVTANVPGGPTCISASYPNCYPASHKGVEVVTDGRHIGTVKEVGQFVTLDAGRGKLVAVESQKFDKLPQVGEKADIQVSWNKAVVAQEKGNSKGNER